MTRAPTTLTSLFLSIGLSAALGAACASAPTSPASCPEISEKACPEIPLCPPPPAAARPPIEVRSEALPTDRERDLELVALSQDGKRALLRVVDKATGAFYQTVDLDISPVPKPDKTWRIEEFGEDLARSKALKALKPDPQPPSQRNAAGVSLVATDALTHIAILALSGERAVVIATLPRLTDDAERPSEVSIPKLAWDPTGTRALVIHKQALAAGQGFQSAWIHVFPVPPTALPF
jgi:hypothetical protein